MTHLVFLYVDNDKDWHRLRPVLDQRQIHNYLVPEVRDETEVQASATIDNRWRVGVLYDEIPVAYRPETCQHKGGKNSIITHSPDGHFKQTSNTKWYQKGNLYTPLYIKHYMLSKEIWESGPKSQLGTWFKKCPCTVRICKATLHYRHKDTCLYSMTIQGWANITYHSSNKSEHMSNTVPSYTQNDHYNDEQTLAFPTFRWHETWFSDETNTLRWK